MQMSVCGLLFEKEIATTWFVTIYMLAQRRMEILALRIRESSKEEYPTFLCLEKAILKRIL